MDWQALDVCISLAQPTANGIITFLFAAFWIALTLQLCTVIDDAAAECQLLKVVIPVWFPLKSQN